MDLKSVLSRVSGQSGKSSNKGEEYLAVKISSSEILATSWTIASGNVAVGKIGDAKIKSSSFEDLLSAADSAVSQALSNQEIPSTQTIFGVNPSWIEDGKIIDQQLGILRKICKELDLKPLGYVLLGEAIECYLKEIEGAPLTAILVGLDGESGWVSLYRAGKNLGTIPLPEDDNVANRVEHALRQFTQLEVLPARMILYDGSRDLKILEEKIMAHPWAKQLPFLHFPKVEILNSENVTKAVAIAGGMQMGARVDISEQIETVAPPVIEQKEQELEEVQVMEEKNEELEEISAVEAGFVQDGDFGKLQDFSVPAEEVTLPKMPALPKLPILPKLPHFNFNFSLPKNVFLIIPLLLLVVGAIGAFLYFVPKVKVYVHVTPKDFRREMTATFSGQIVEVSEIGSKKGVATGRKMVGDKAKGSVTIYSAASAKTLAAGSQIISPDGLKFSLDEGVNVASASDFLTPATVNSKVTAFDIGEKYNLSSGTKFTINGLSSSYLAKNESAFSGGNAHEATVVTKVDQERLLATLSAELTNKAQSDLNAKLESGLTLLPNAITSSVVKKKFSKDVDDEADMVSLDLTIDFKGITVSQEDLISRFMDKYSKDIDEGYQLDRPSANPEIKTVKMDKTGNAGLAMVLNARLLPVINPDTLIKSISGKSKSNAQSYLTNIAGVSSVEIETNPKFLQFITNEFLPWKTTNVTVEVVSD